MSEENKNSKIGCFGILFLLFILGTIMDGCESCSDRASIDIDGNTALYEMTVEHITKKYTVQEIMEKIHMVAKATDSEVDKLDLTVTIKYENNYGQNKSDTFTFTVDDLSEVRKYKEADDYQYSYNKDVISWELDKEGF